ncbi:MAG: hypothetical protein CVU56_25255 [Deltaproteobacteria bacterium HGW-Deltaproteobacteria-14]|jgi:hypothetical protein|nr:MAG: hypothetical protein CVU56_25255 [Deltaproteobacteria bacterium HGW-Deltaproteobacteria-14]
MRGDSVNDTIAALVDLQAIDDEISEYKQQRDELAGNLERLEQILAQMAEGLNEKRDRLAEATRFHEEKRVDLEADGERLNNAKKKLGTVTRTKEYAAMQRELDNLRKKFSDDEAELKRLAEAIAEYKTAISAEEKKLDELREEFEREQAANADRLGELDGTIAEIAKKKVQVIAKLQPKSLLPRYQRLLERREGKAVVPVVGGGCVGCRMMLPPQLYIIVQRGEKLETCPSCQRFLFYSAELAAQLASGT